jgi:GNAT superfamily N-acetyltransferase
MPPTLDPATVLTADEAAPDALAAFLAKVYKPGKAAFLAEHGEWWYHGNENRWLMCDETGSIVAYCAIIPTRALLGGSIEESLWWVDLIVLPEHRGRGLQHILDERVRDARDLKLGFPNELAAKIHLKHGWGVRDDLRWMVAPLMPHRLKRVQSGDSAKGMLLRIGAGLLRPIAALWRMMLAGYRPRNAREVPTPDAAALSAVFMRHNAPTPITTTYRDADFIQWRYLDAAYRDQLRTYTAGPADAPTHVLITRTFAAPHAHITRVLDIFGDFGDATALRDVLRLGLRDAVQAGSAEFVAIATEPRVIAALRAVGCVLSVGGLFCWHSPSADKMETLARSTCHWTFADSDNDE